MKLFKSHKEVTATPMNRLDYTVYRDWELPADEDGADEGYLVEYLDGGKPNHAKHKGYISWSPKAQFDNGYTAVKEEFMSFGEAVEAMKKGEKVARTGWNGKGMWLVLIHAGNAMYQGFDMQDCIGMKTAGNVMQPGWLANQPDMLARDWVCV